MTSTEWKRSLPRACADGSSVGGGWLAGSREQAAAAAPASATTSLAALLRAFAGAV